VIESTFAPSGRQYEISAGDQHAVVVEVGGGLRTYRIGDVAVLDGYGTDEMCTGAHGQPLIPWPNRLGDGTYTFDGNRYTVPLTEPDKQNAIHGFLRWRNWESLEHTTSRVVVGTVLHPLSGYPFGLDVRVAYELRAEGLEVTISATNIGPRPAPWACGAHPYLSAGGGLLDDCTLEFTAGIRIETDDERQLPTGEVPVGGTPYDFSTPRTIGAQAIDHAFADVARGADGRAHVLLTGVDGHRRELWCDDSFPYLEIYTGDTQEEVRRRTGLGVEPMTAPPNAFASGESVVRLEPGATVSHVWGMRLAD
jgi:aldose 1-epimerase